MNESKTLIWWIRSDLRFEYQPELYQYLNKYDYFLPVYCIPDISESTYGIASVGQHRIRFRRQCLLDLQYRLREMQSDLLVLDGRPEQRIPELIHQIPNAHIVCEKAVSYNEIQEEAHLESLGIQLTFYAPNMLFSASELPFTVSNLPNTYTPFKKFIEHLEPKLYSFTTPNCVPNLPSHTFEHIHQLKPIEIQVRYTGGRTSGSARLREYFAEHGHIGHYKETRNGMLHENDSAKISPWLAWGCLHVKEVWKAVLDFEQLLGANDSTLWMKYELLWREYFKWLEIKFGARMYTLQNLKGCTLQYQWNPQVFRRWCNAQTGDALTDAGMQELIQTGYTSNRARQNMASYLMHELQQPWLAGAQWFEHHLVDYDPGSNYGNWAYIAGCGCTPGPSRRFNTQKQKDTYDPDGAYIAKWLNGNL